jgi:plasmid replication initiation protein
MTVTRPQAAVAEEACTLKRALNRLGETVEQTAPPPSMRQAPANDNQPDFFVPTLYDIPVKDGIGLMDIAVFRLSKKQTRKGDIISYELPDAIVEVAGGAHGMATIYDYDIVLMVISYLADAVQRHRAGRSEMPTKKFRPHSTEVFKFCRLHDGGKQYQSLEAALRRLQGTFITITSTNASKALRRTGYFPLLAGAEVVSRTDTGKIGTLEVTIPDWIFEGVVNHKTPEVLTVNPDYFLIQKGLARFVYRLARKAAGTDTARYLFRTLHQRSGSTREFKKFCHDLRQLIAVNDLPDFDLTEENGKDGPVLRMTARS